MKKRIVVAVALLSLLAGGLSYRYLTAERPLAAALYYEPARPLGSFVLQAAGDEQLGPEQLRDRWTLIFLGYTYCPDICPTTLARLVNAQPKLQQYTDKSVQILFVSVDPARDTSARLQQYSAFFKAPFLLAATAPHPRLQAFTRSLGLMYAVPEASGDDYSVAHSASVALINPQGRLQALFRPVLTKGQLPLVDGSQLIADFAEIVRRYNTDTFRPDQR